MIAALETRTIERQCQTCGDRFTAVEMMVLGKAVAGQLRCDPCVAAYNERQQRRNRPIKVQRAESVLRDYPAFNPDHPKLPETIKPHLQRLEDWQPSSRGIGFVGPSHIGKTRAIYHFARQWERYRTWAVISDSEVNSLVRDVTHFGKAQREKLSETKRADMILWDDFGVAKMTDAVEKFYIDVLSHAQRRGTPIFATLNHCGRQLLENWQSDTGETRFTQGEDGKRILNRLFERCEVINLYP